LARALRRASILVLVLLILFTATVAYSTSEIAQSPPQVSAFSVGFDPNGTVDLATGLTLNNPGFFPIDAFTLDARVVMVTGTFLGAFRLGPTSLAGGATDVYPIALYLPVSASSPGASLLVQSQYLSLNVWGNATFGLLFPAGISIEQSRFWGAPFSDLNYTIGNLTMNGSLPVTITFQNEAPLTEAGTLRLAVVSATGTTCGSATWTLLVSQGQDFDETQPMALSPGCSPADGTIRGAYVTPEYTVVLPSEAIP
jgi:hypothetical protein